MKRKEIIMIGSIVGGLSTCSFEEQKAQNQEKISKTLSEKISLEVGYSNLQQEKWIPTLRVSISDLEGPPLWWSKRMIQPNYWNLLGFSQVESIMREYNDLPDSVEFSATERLESEDEISFPLIYPELEDYFPKERENLCLNESFSKYQNIKISRYQG